MSVNIELTAEEFCLHYEKEKKNKRFWFEVIKYPHCHLVISNQSFHICISRIFCLTEQRLSRTACPSILSLRPRSGACVTRKRRKRTTAWRLSYTAWRESWRGGVWVTLYHKMNRWVSYRGLSAGTVYVQTKKWYWEFTKLTSLIVSKRSEYPAKAKICSQYFVHFAMQFLFLDIDSSGS